MANNDDDIAKMLYAQAIANEVYPDEPDGDSLAILNMLSEIRKLGYPIYYFADISHRRSIKDPKVIDILLKYYHKMDSVCIKADILSKIDPKKYPSVLELALKEYNSLSPLDKEYFSPFQNVISRGKTSNTYISLLFSLLEDPDNYASGFIIRKRLLKSAPDKLKILTFRYIRGVLFPSTLSELASYSDYESIEILRRATSITEDEVEQLKSNNSYSLCVTMYEQNLKLCSVEYIQRESKRFLKKSLLI